MTMRRTEIVHKAEEGMTKWVFALFLAALCLGFATPQAGAQQVGPAHINVIPLPGKSSPELPLTGFQEETTTLPDSQAADIAARIRGMLLNTDSDASLPVRQLPDTLRQPERAVLPGAARPAPQTTTDYYHAAHLAPAGRSKASQNAVSAYAVAVQGQTAPEVSMRSIGTPRQMKIEGGWQPPEATAAKLSAAAVGKRNELTARAFLNSYRSYLHIDCPDDEFELQRSNTDELNTTHLRFSQTYGGLPVWPSEIIVHLNTDQKVYLVDGDFVPTPKNLSTSPTVSSASAVDTARLLVPGGGKAQVSEPVLIIYARSQHPVRLAWKMNVNVNPLSQWLVIVDAQNEKVLFANNTVENSNQVGQGVDLLGKSDVLDVWLDGGPYYLCDTSKPMFSSTGKAPASGVPDLTNTNGTIIILDAAHASFDTGTFTPGTVKSSALKSGWLPDAVSAYSNFNWTYEYYLNTFKRNSIDNKGMNIPAIVRVYQSGQSWLNACWVPNLQLMYFGDQKPLAAATDVIGHELTHGVTNHTANLGSNGTGQTGALNEGFSDIFGKMVEYFSHGSAGTIDWIMGDSVGVPLRNLKDPNSQVSGECGQGNPYPANMSQYYDPTANNLSDGGVHCNSNIFSHSFYMLAVGLSTAIGIPDASKIYYRALTTHLTSQAQFIDARLACVQSATELFGASSNQVKQTNAAFDAVQISSGSTPSPPPAPPGSGSDAALVIAYDAYDYIYRVARYEGGSAGFLSSTAHPANPYQRPSVTADGKTAAYVTAGNDLCMMPTDGSSSEVCLGSTSVYSCAMAPDGKHFGFVLLNSNGSPQNKISVVNLSNNTTHTYTLVGAGTEGVKTSSVLYADTMALTASNRYLIYDALNSLTMSDNSKLNAWSLYAIDLTTGQTLALIPPYAGLEIGDPAIGHTSDYFLTFEAVNSAGYAYIYAANLSNGKSALDQNVYFGPYAVTYAVPAYTGDDSKLAFTVPDSSVYTGASIYVQPLGSDHITASGSPSKWLAEGELGAVYRRANLYALNVNNASPAKGVVTSSVGSIVCGQNCSYLYPANTTVTLTASAYGGDQFTGWSGACTGKAACQVKIQNAAVNVTASFASIPAVPQLSLPTSSSKTTTGATLGATIVYSAGETITASGVAYAKSANPTISGTHVSTSPVVKSKAFTVKVIGLTPNTVYYFRGYATDATGTGYTANASFTTLPNPPAAKTATVVSASGFTANWAAPGSEGSAAITGYRLDVAADSAFTQVLAGYNNLLVSGTSRAVTGLSAAKPYYYRVRAVNAGGVSASSTAIKVTTATK
jgi:bacillolysin